MNLKQARNLFKTKPQTKTTSLPKTKTTLPISQEDLSKEIQKAYKQALDYVGGMKYFENRKPSELKGTKFFLYLQEETKSLNRILKTKHKMPSSWNLFLNDIRIIYKSLSSKDLVLKAEVLLNTKTTKTKLDVPIASFPMFLITNWKFWFR